MFGNFESTCIVSSISGEKIWKSQLMSCVANQCTADWEKENEMFQEN